MLRIALPLLPLLVTPVLADAGLHHHPHGVEFGWLTVALVGSAVGGALAYAALRGRK